MAGETSRLPRPLWERAYFKARGVEVAGRALARPGALPSFLIIGAQKAGTGSLMGWLRHHPQVVWAARGELHHFSSHPLPDLDEYRRSFPPSWLLAGLSRLRGRPVVTAEKCPNYLCEPAAPQRIVDALGEIPMVAILREPGARAFSHWRMRVRAGAE